MKSIIKILGIIMLVMMITVGTVSCASSGGAATETPVEADATENAEE